MEKRSLYSVVLAFLSVLCSLSVAGCKDKKASGADAILSAFQGGCQSQGRWTDIALSQNDAIAEAIQSIQAKDACAPYASTFQSIQSLSTQVSHLLRDPNFSNLRVAEEKVQELTLALQNNSEPTTGMALQTALAEAHVNLADAKGVYRVSGHYERADRYAQSTQMLASTLESMLIQTSGMTACLQQSPATAVQMANSLIAIGGSFVAPVYGAGAAVIGQLINMGIEYAKQSGDLKALWQLNMDKMPSAMACGLESMTELYCQANDAYDLVDFQIQRYPRPGAPADPLWSGIDLQGRRMPILVSWLQGVKNGSISDDTPQAEKQTRVWKKIFQLDSVNRAIKTELKYLSRLLAGANNDEAKFNLMVKKTAYLAEYLSGSYSSQAMVTNGTISEPSGPFADFSSERRLYACYLIRGFEVDEEHKCPDAKEISEGAESFIRTALRDDILGHIKLSRLDNNWEAIFSTVREQVDIEFKQTITIDPKALLASAFEKKAGNLSPYEILQRIRTFLAELQIDSKSTNPQRGPLLTETIAMVDQVIGILNTSIRVDSSPLDLIQRIFSILQLGQGVQFFEGRVQQFIQWDIDQRLETGELPSDINDILWESYQSVRDRLMASGLENLSQVTSDLNESRSMTQRNISNFRSYFESIFEWSIERLDSAAREAREPSAGPNRPNGQFLARLCTLALITEDEWSLSKGTWKICSKAVLESVYSRPEEPLRIVVGDLEKQLRGTPYQRKMCAYHRFTRSERIAEIMRTRSRPGRHSNYTAPYNLVDIFQSWI